MKVVLLTVMLAVLTGPAFAQGINLLQEGKRPVTQEEVDRQKAIDEAYKSSMGKIPDQKPSTDPWGNVRASPPAKTTKTQSGAK